MGWRGLIVITAPIVAVSMMGAYLSYRGESSAGWALWLFIGLLAAILVPLLRERVIATRPEVAAPTSGPAPARPRTRTTEDRRIEPPDDTLARIAALRLAVTKAEAHAEQMSQEKAAFLARVNHELRTPLNGVVGVLELMRNQTLDESERDKYLDTAYVSCRHIMRIINDNLDLARMDEGQLALRCNPFRVSDCIDALHQMMSVSMREKALRFACDVADDVPTTVIGDRDRLMQVLVNLAENAHKFTNAGGTVSLAVSVEPNDAPVTTGVRRSVMLRFAVEDTGIGIRRESHENIFAAFAQASEAGANIREGSGLGLAICARLVALMGGEIGVESEYGHGSLFWFTIRLDIDAHETGRARGVPVDVGAGGEANAPLVKTGAATPGSGPIVADSGLLAPQGLRVLLVDDNQINRKVAERLLALDSHRVISKENGQLALEAVKRDQFDVVLMDIHMPVMDGHEATRRIRASERGTDEHMPIIAITASSLSEEVERIFASGMDDVVSKPVTLDSLRAALAHIEHVQ